MSSGFCARAGGAICNAAIEAMIAAAHDIRHRLLPLIMGASPDFGLADVSSGDERLAAAAMSFTMSGHAICGSASARPHQLVACDRRAGPAARERAGPEARRADRGAARGGRVPRLRLRLQWWPAPSALERPEPFPPPA